MSGRLRSALLAVPLMMIMIVVVGLAVGAPSAVASCRYAADDPELTESADVIFTGEIVHDQTAKLGREREYTFRVAKVFKGAAYSEQLVATENRSSEALNIEGPGTFLVLADFGSGESDGPVTRLISNGCSGTRLVTEADAVPGTLGPGQEPTVGSSRSVTSTLHRQALDGRGSCLLRRRDRGQPPGGPAPQPRTAVVVSPSPAGTPNRSARGHRRSPVTGRAGRP